MRSSVVDVRRVEGPAAEQPRRDEGEQGPQPDEDRRGRQPPAVADPAHAREAHHDRERDAEEDELRAEREPVPDRRLRVAAGEPVVVPPPDVQHRERQLRGPDEGEADHPEQHPGADRAGRRLAHPAHAVAREEAEHDELRDGLPEPEEPLDAAVVLRALQRVRREERVLVEVRQVVRRQRRPPEQPRRDRPDGGEPARRSAARLRVTPSVVSSPSSGLACGYASVSEVEVRVRLRVIAQRVGREVAQPPRRRALDERVEPGQDRGDEERAARGPCPRERPGSRAGSGTRSSSGSAAAALRPRDRADRRPAPR